MTQDFQEPKFSRDFFAYEMANAPRNECYSENFETKFAKKAKKEKCFMMNLNFKRKTEMEESFFQLFNIMQRQKN